MNLGIQDAVNLGWKLASVVDGHASGRHYSTPTTQERHPRCRRDVLGQHPGPVRSPRARGRRHRHARPTRRPCSAPTQANEQVAAAMSGMDVCYAHGAPQSLGRQDAFPTAEVVTPMAGRAQNIQLASRSARRPPRLRERGPGAGGSGCPTRSTTSPRRRRCTNGGCPYSGGFDVPSALLIRPDGHVAWVSPDTDSRGLTEALDALKGSTSAVWTTAGQPKCAVTQPFY